jgi:hypothetical protein
MSEPFLTLLQAIGAFALGYAGGQALLYLLRRDDKRGPKGWPMRGEAEPLPAAQPELSEADFRLIDNWAKLNPWYLADPVLRHEAAVIHGRLNSTRPDLTLIENLAAVTVVMHARHAEIVPSTLH